MMAGQLTVLGEPRTTGSGSSPPLLAGLIMSTVKVNQLLVFSNSFKKKKSIGTTETQMQLIIS